MMPRLRRLRRSLGLRLVLLFVALALATTAVFTIGMQRALSGGWSALVRPLLADYLDRLTDELGTPPDPARAAALAQRLPLSIRIEGPQVQWDSGTAARRGPWRGDARGPGARGPGARGDGGRDGGGRDDGGRGDGGRGDGSRGGEARGSNVPGSSDRGTGLPSDEDRTADERLPGHRGDRFLVRTTADGHRVTYGIAADAWERRPRLIGWFTLALLLALTAVAYFATRRLVRPIDDIRAGALRFGRGDFSAPIPQRRDDELGELARQVNAMAASLQRMLEARRGLLLAASHELRSPLTRARLNAELVAQGPAREALLRDLAEMRELIASLLEGERLAAGSEALHREPLDPDALVRALVAEQFAGLPLELSLHAGPGPFALDAVRLRLLLRNLLDNARRHGAAATEPAFLGTALDGDALVITVRDRGPGLPAQALSRLGEPFYRPDAARPRATGGVGLGLYLCRLVAEAHGGSIAFADAGPGLMVTVRLPAPPAPAAVDGPPVPG